MNQRNYAYIMRYNPPGGLPDVDDKLRTKQLAIRHHVATAELIGSIRHQYEVRVSADIDCGCAGLRDQAGTRAAAAAAFSSSSGTTA